MKSLLPLKTSVSAAILAFCVFHHCAFAQSNPLFVVRERLLQPTGTFCPEGRIVVGLSYSEITVSNGGQVQHAAWTVPACSDPAHAREWAAPAGNKVRRFSLPPVVLDQLKGFLDSAEVRTVRDFLNAGPGVGDYEIEIHRASGTQRIPVVSLMPEHDELKRDPTLLLLICKAKEIGGDERPHWCPNSPQTEPVGTRQSLTSAILE